MINCRTCIYDDECEYKNILYQLNDGIESGIITSKVPFTCDLNCSKYSNKNIPVIPMLNIKNASRITRHYVGKCIRKSLFPDKENFESYRLIDIVEISTDVYMVISYVSPTVICDTEEDVLIYQYMLVSVLHREPLSLRIFHGYNYRINLLKPAYLRDLEGSKTFYQLSSNELKILMCMLTKNNGINYAILCNYANGLIDNQYWHICRKHIQKLDMPNYLELS